jgi:hypothetical protein
MRIAEGSLMQIGNMAKVFMALAVSTSVVCFSSVGAIARGGGGHGGGGHGGGGYSGGMSSGGGSGWHSSTNFNSVNGPGPTFATGFHPGHGGFLNGGRRGWGYGYGYGGYGVPQSDGNWGNGPEWGNGGGYGYAGNPGGGYGSQDHVSSGVEVKTYSWPNSSSSAPQANVQPVSTGYTPNSMSSGDKKATQSTLDNLIRDTNKW